MFILYIHTDAPLSISLCISITTYVHSLFSSCDHGQYCEGQRVCHFQSGDKVHRSTGHGTAVQYLAASVIRNLTCSAG